MGKRRIYLAPVVLFGTLALLVACQPESLPEPTAVPTPTASTVPTPTAVPSPTVTPTVLPQQEQSSPPEIELTFVPEYGSEDNLRGRVTGVENPADYQIAVFIGFASGWWTKPYWDSPSTSIAADGTWEADITTGENDAQAAQIAVYLLPTEFDPPLMRGEKVFPVELVSNAVTSVIVEREHEEETMRVIRFSGLRWQVKSSSVPVGPGPNVFSDSPENVWVDADGQLHLKITYRDGYWLCAEVIAEQSLGYGTYVFHLASRVDRLDPNAVLGMFTWDTDAPEHHYREIDIEFARWGQDNADNMQYVVQPYTSPDNMKQYTVSLDDGPSTYQFVWRQDSVIFQSTQGQTTLEFWAYTGPDVPPAGGETVRINLWLFNGAAPTDGQEIEVVFDRFEFIPPE
ncbi:MAG: hypothetical protein JXJ17_06160 [Anaerolineae bacterium]|nr:hypothetical protein [Anaerolineae bacterium]